MDFLEIRRKAKERAAARAAAAAPRPPLGLEPLPVPVAEGSPGPEAASPGRQGSWSPAPEEPSAPGPEGEPPPAWGAGTLDDPLLTPSEAEALEAAKEALQRTAAAQAEEQARAEAELEGKLRDLQVAPDARFSTYRPSGPAPARAEWSGREGRGAAGERAGAVVAAPTGPQGPAWDHQGEEGDEPDAPRALGDALANLRPPPRALDPLDDFFYRADEPGPDLGELALPAPPPVQVPEVDQKVEYLTFLLGAEVYGVEIDRVREVMRAPPITEVPRAPADVLGVITVRGEVVAVFDPRARLGLPPSGPADGGRVVIVDDGGGPCGLQVDAVASVVRLLRGQVEACPTGLGGASGDCLEGIGRDRDRLFTVLSVPALLKQGRRQAEVRG